MAIELSDLDAERTEASRVSEGFPAGELSDHRAHQDAWSLSMPVTPRPDSEASLTPRRESGVALLAAENSHDAERPLSADEEPAPGQRCSAMYHQELNWIVSHPRCDTVILSLVALNTAQLALVHRGLSPQWQHGLAIAEATFTLIFLNEVLLKLAAMGARTYFTSPSHLFDFAVTIVSSLPLLVTNAATSSITAMRALRALRALRLSRLARRFPAVRQVLAAAIGTMQHLLALCHVALACSLSPGVIRCVDMTG